MKSRIEGERMISGRLYCPFRVGDDSAARVHAAQKRFNDSEFWHDRAPLDELRACFAAAPEDLQLTPPVYFDHATGYISAATSMPTLASLSWTYARSSSETTYTSAPT